MTVYDILDLLAYGMTESDILADYPDLTLEDIRASLAFAADRESRLVGANCGAPPRPFSRHQFCSGAAANASSPEWERALCLSEP
jgi:hypothetical protein